MNTPNPRAAAAYDVVIVGGGMVGSLLACALSDSTLKVAVIERQRPASQVPADYDRRVSALTLASRAMLDAVHAWSSVAARRFAPVAAMHVWEDANEVQFDATEIGEPCLAYIVENSVVVAALHERLEQSTNVHLLVGGEISDVSITEAAAEIALVDGRRLKARLLVAADGADSAVRERLGMPLRTMNLAQQAIVATVRTAQAHLDIARQRFLATGPLAFLPLPDAHTCSIVWSLDSVRAEELLALDDAGFVGPLTEAFGDRLGAIEQVGARLSFPLSLAHAERYIDERIALIGDAAHTVHPLAGQGVNLGFLDAATLAEVILNAAERRRDIGLRHVLRRYERWRKGDNLAMIAVTGGFKYLFGSDWPLLSGLRAAGLSLTDRAGPLKQIIMRRASGLAGDLPMLARRSGR
ncbi:MAG: UbiH/UbiF/VisC/COQ6 family ubiquinone biosynthesis hydroxylase [Gammaproteobacteria bacterium]|nr:UbiH/UbiF/VisC/COQ6 family ubiquinone biosynthesis hydroxylase [Gammaproteobacteria bacterium]